MSDKEVSKTDGTAVPSGIWRDGPFLVVRKKWRNFPDRCIICNEEANGVRGMVRVRDARHGGGMLVFLFLGLWLYLALPSAVVFPGFCRHHRSRPVARLAVLSLVLTSMLAVAALFVPVSDIGVVPKSIVMGVMQVAITASGLAFVILGLAAALQPKSLTAKKIDRNFVWIDGVSQDYALSFPELPRT